MQRLGQGDDKRAVLHMMVDKRLADHAVQSLGRPSIPLGKCLGDAPIRTQQRVVRRILLFKRAPETGLASQPALARASRRDFSCGRSNPSCPRRLPHAIGPNVDAELSAEASGLLLCDGLQARLLLRERLEGRIAVSRAAEGDSAWRLSPKFAGKLIEDFRPSRRLRYVERRRLLP